MRRPLLAQLARVRSRQSWQFAAAAAAAGLLVSGVAAAAMGALRWLGGWAVDPSVAAAVLAAGPTLGFVVAMVWPRSWHAAAAAVDDYYRLKDRAVTALAFLGRTPSDAVRHLQVADAERHVAAIDPKAVVPYRAPRLLPYAGLAAVAALALLLWPAGTRDAAASLAAHNELLADEVLRLEEQVNDLAELAKELDVKDLAKLADEMRAKVDELSEERLEQREALAKLSELQSAVQAAMAQYNVEAVDAQLREMGEALALAEALSSAGKAMASGKFEKAMDELNKVEAPKLDSKESRALKREFERLAKQARESGMSNLAEAAESLCQGCEGDESALERGLDRLKQCMGENENRRTIKALLAAQLASLCDCKGACQAQGGKPTSKAVKSDRPSNSWGTAKAGNIDGERTDLASNRNLEQLSGQSSEGPSEVIDTIKSADGDGQSQREYREVYNKYRRMSEAVLESEPIPLGHRQTIRRYFELIRPEEEARK